MESYLEFLKFIGPLFMIQFRLIFGSFVCAVVMTVSCNAYGQKQGSSWVVFDLGDPPLHIHLPSTPEPMETQIQASMLEIMQAYYAYSYESADHRLLVMLLQTSYAQHIHPDLNLVSDQTVRELESHGALKVKYTSSKVEIEKKKGVRQKGTLEIKGDAMNFTTTILSDGSNVWKVIVCTKVGYVSAMKEGQEVVYSMTFKGK